MPGSGKKTKSVPVTPELVAPLGTQGNPIKGPPVETFTGPATNYTPPTAHLDSGEASPLGSQGNPMVGPPIGSSPGVQNPGGATATTQGPASFVHVDEEIETRERKARAAGGEGHPVVHTAPAKVITTEEGSNRARVETVEPKKGETQLEAAQRTVGERAAAKLQAEEAAKAKTTGEDKAKAARPGHK